MHHRPVSVATDTATNRLPWSWLPTLPSQSAHTFSNGAGVCLRNGTRKADGCRVVKFVRGGVGRRFEKAGSSPAKVIRTNSIFRRNPQVALDATARLRMGLVSILARAHVGITRFLPRYHPLLGEIGAKTTKRGKMTQLSVTKAKAAVEKAKQDHGHGSREVLKAKKALRAAREAGKQREGLL